MNTYLLALIGLLGMFVVGVICFGFLFKSMVGDNEVKLTPMRFVIAAIGMYVIAWIFIWFFKNTMITGATGAMKGIELGLMAGIAFFTVPLFADAGYFKSGKMNIEWVLIANWLLSFVVLGLIVGSLA